MKNETTEKNTPEELNAFYAELGQIYVTISQSDQPPIAKLGLYATRSLQLFESHRNRFEENPIGIIAAFAGNDGTWFNTNAAIFAGTIAAATSAGKTRNIDPERAGVLFLNAIFALVIRRIQAATTNSLEDDVRYLIDLFLNGIISERKPAPVAQS